MKISTTKKELQRAFSKLTKTTQLKSQNPLVNYTYISSSVSGIVLHSTDLEVGIKTHTESLKESLSYYPDKFEFDVVNPSSDHNINKYSNKLEKYDGLIWGGSSLNIYNDTDEIGRQIEFMKECQKKVRKILAICWGMQVAVVAAGGEVKKSSKG